jgi:hypothetical protein
MLETSAMARECYAEEWTLVIGPDHVRAIGMFTRHEQWPVVNTQESADCSRSGTQEAQSDLLVKNIPERECSLFIRLVPYSRT